MGYVPKEAVEWGANYLLGKFGTEESITDRTYCDCKTTEEECPVAMNGDMSACFAALLGGMALERLGAITIDETGTKLPCDAEEHRYTLTEQGKRIISGGANLLITQGMEL